MDRHWNVNLGGSHWPLCGRALCPPPLGLYQVGDSTTRDLLQLGLIAPDSLPSDSTSAYHGSDFFSGLTTCITVVSPSFPSFLTPAGDYSLVFEFELLRDRSKGFG